MPARFQHFQRVLSFVSITLAAFYLVSAHAEILIATAGPFTGTNIFRGEQIQQGAEMAVADINANGGVLGEQVELLIADDACDPEQAVAVANKLEAWNKELENRVTAQVEELQHVAQLKRFFPPQLADAIVSDENTGILEDHRSEVTVIFCDLRGFTEFSSLSEPEEEMRVLREYHAVVCPLIFKYGATLEHFAGDGVMSFQNRTRWRVIFKGFSKTGDDLQHSGTRR
jgi:hypothetical protein